MCSNQALKESVDKLTTAMEGNTKELGLTNSAVAVLNRGLQTAEKEIETLKKHDRESVKTTANLAAKLAVTAGLVVLLVNAFAIIKFTQMVGASG